MLSRIWASSCLLFSLVASGEEIKAFGKKWQVPKAAEWEATKTELHLKVAKPPTPQQVRRPIQFAVAEQLGDFSSLQLDLEVKRNEKSLIIVFAYQDEAHFNYAHLSVDNPSKVKVHNGIFQAFGGERERLSPSPDEPGSLPTTDWTPVKLIWDGRTGGVGERQTLLCAHLD
jgi:hypothetical protein